jgi:hypothetical protein
MLRSVKELKGYSIQTMDGVKGSVADFFFDDATWTLRYLVADTGHWLPGRKVLISPAAFKTPDWEQKIFPVDLTKEQIEKSPDVDADKPVSRQEELRILKYFQWIPYWDATGMPTYGFRGLPHEITATEKEREAGVATLAHKGDPHLRSAREVIGYRIHAQDGDFGRIDDLLVDDLDWVIRYVGVATGSWLKNRRVLVASPWIKEVRWADSTVVMDLTQEEIRNSPEYDPSVPIDRAYEERLFRHYNRPRYWKS